MYSLSFLSHNHSFIIIIILALLPYIFSLRPKIRLGAVGSLLESL